MCGIAGILARDGDPGARDERLRRMTAALAHRGPDDRGFYSDDRVGFGFRRLAVIDLKTGAQPIRLEDDRAVIVLNGEIYNFRELRRDLERRQTFRSTGDVEVVLRLYAEEGIACLKRLRGMFALAIWDRPARTLYLARDRFGIKPLFVCRQADGLAFASEVGALLAGGFPERRALDPVELRQYLAYKYVSPTGSILAGVASVPPAMVLEAGPGGERLTPYWEPPELDPAPGSAREVEARIAETLRAAVRRQLVADVPVGVFLSGGVDSSTLTALVREVGEGPLRTFSVGFDRDDVANELPAARRVATTLGTEHSEIVMDPWRVATDLEAILSRLDAPFGDATAIPTWYISRLARERVTVALSGEGADEVFGGYPRQAYDIALDRIGMAGRRLLPGLLRVSGRGVSPALALRLKMVPGLRRYLDWSRLLSADAIESMALAPCADEEALLRLHAGEAEAFTRSAGHDRFRARLEADRRLFLAGDLLPKVDRMSMAHSLEVRVPYLDDDVVNLLITLPGPLKVSLRRDKRALRRIASALLGPEIGRRRKQGFDVPIGRWLRGPLRDALLDHLSEAAVRRRGLFRPEPVGALVREHLSGERDHGATLWLLLTLEAWQQRALDRAPAPPR
jgi:asparagine synthase (glutamine-hydrolysing)